MITNIDLEAFKFIEKLTVQTPVKTSNQMEKAPDLKGLGKAFELGEVSDFGIEQFDEETYLTKSKFQDIDGKLVGLNPSEYAEFKDFILAIFENPHFSNSCDFKTLIDASFEWLLEVYKFKQARTNLTNFLFDKIQSLTKEFHFYFKLKAIAIESCITIGNTEIKFFSNEEIQHYYSTFKKEKPETSFQEFNDLYHFDAIHALVKIKSVSNRANDIAFKEAELSVDVLKCFCCHYSTDKLIQMFDLDHRFKPGSTSSYFDFPNGDIKDSALHVKTLGGRVPIQLTNAFIEDAKSRGLNTFSTFLKNKKKQSFTTLPLI